LAVEILSQSNTEQEMDRELREYFQAGVELVWYIEPQSRTARVYTGVRGWTQIGPNDSLLGGEVLPGFALPLARLFARVEAPRDD
jgi:Uma2 family endonuclease